MDQGCVKLLSSKQREEKFGSMDWAICREVSRKTQKTSIEEACFERCQASIELVSSRRKEGFSRREKHM